MLYDLLSGSKPPPVFSRGDNSFVKKNTFWRLQVVGGRWGWGNTSKGLPLARDLRQGNAWQANAGRGKVARPACAHRRGSKGMAPRERRQGNPGTAGEPQQEEPAWESTTGIFLCITWWVEGRLPSPLPLLPLYPLRLFIWFLHSIIWTTGSTKRRTLL